MRKNKKALALIVLATVLTVAVVALSIRPSVPAFMVTPQPNGYETLARAAIRLAEINDSLWTNNAFEFVPSKSEVYELISKALKQRVEAPPETYNYSGGMKVMQDLMGFRRLERALHIKSKFLTNMDHSFCFLVGSAIEINSTKKLAGLLSLLNTNELLSGGLFPADQTCQISSQAGRIARSATQRGRSGTLVSAGV
jgi:hypothetical protein